MIRENYSTVNIAGKKFGRLTAIEKVAGTKSKWLCVCDCGNQIALYYSRIKGGQLSCGCLRKECMDNFGASHTTHGQSKTKLYRKYKSMIRRCYNENDNSYSRYGAKGISVCDEWLNSFEAFYKWAMATGYDPSKDGRKEQSIDRINTNGNYCPENCRWATAKEQQKNRNITRLYEYHEEMYSASEFADEFGITDKSFVYRRLSKGQTLEYILGDWIKIHNVPKHLIEVEDFAKEHNVHTATVRRWINKGKIEGEKIGRKWYVVP